MTRPRYGEGGGPSRGGALVRALPKALVQHLLLLFQAGGEAAGLGGDLLLLGGIGATEAHGNQGGGPAPRPSSPLLLRPQMGGVSLPWPSLLPPLLLLRGRVKVREVWGEGHFTSPSPPPLRPEDPALLRATLLLTLDRVLHVAWAQGEEEGGDDSSACLRHPQALLWSLPLPSAVCARPLLGQGAEGWELQVSPPLAPAPLRALPLPSSGPVPPLLHGLVISCATAEEVRRWLGAVHS